MANFDFTTNEEIEAFEVGDNTIEIKAYVDGVETIKYVGKNSSKALFKFVVNNGSGKRIRVLLWEDNAKLYQSKIVNLEIVHIERALYLPVNQTFFRKEDNVIPFELSLSKNSSIRLLGKYIMNEINPPQITNTTIKDCVNVEGKLSVEGFIKVTFTPITTSYSSYGSGAIMDDIYKLRLHINNFHHNPALIEGAHVKVVGEVKRDKYDSIYLHVEDLDHIEILDTKILPPQQLRCGIYAPRKRAIQSGAIDDNTTHSPTKKSCDETQNPDLNDSGLLSPLLFNEDETSN